MKRRPWTFAALVAAVFVALIALSRGAWTGFLPGCLFHRVTGLHCPGCGGTRCAMLMLRGDVAGALAMNAFAVLFGACGAVFVALAVWRESRNEPVPRIPPWSAWTLLAVFLVFGLTRNLPWWPFSLLAPH